MSAQQVRDSASWNSRIRDKEFVDAIIESGGQSFVCHQIILATSSTVFCAMFQADMREKETRKVFIEDIKPEVIALMLHWIYTGSNENGPPLCSGYTTNRAVEPHSLRRISPIENVPDEMSMELLRAADKYQLDKLKELCEANLCSILHVTNALELLVFGYLHNATRLKNAALKLVARNQATLSKTKVYQDFLIQFPRLACEVKSSQSHMD